MTDYTTSTPSPPSSDDSSDDSAGLIVFFIFIKIIIVLIVVAVVISCLRRAMQQHNVPAISPLTTVVIAGGSRIEFATIERFLDDFRREKPMRFTAQNLTDFTRNYAEKLGSGGFGTVYKGNFPNGMCIAVKVLHRIKDKGAEEQFMAEVGTIGLTYHVNLVKLYGFCFDAEVRALVYEYMENGSLERYLFDKTESIEWGKLYEAAIGTAKGIQYLHEECEKKIVHYDIKPGNVLLSSSFAPKVADFGLARLCDREMTHIVITGARGTPGYAAPELWLPFPVTEKCDVYSFGMMLFEILGRRRNFVVGIDSSSSMDWFPRWLWKTIEETATMEAVISGCGIEAEERERAERLCKVVIWCVQYQPAARPSMRSVVRMLEGDMEIVEPGNPFQYMDPNLAASNIGDESLGDTTSSSLHIIGGEMEIVELGV